MKRQTMKGKSMAHLGQLLILLLPVAVLLTNGASIHGPNGPVDQDTYSNEAEIEPFYEPVAEGIEKDYDSYAQEEPVFNLEDEDEEKYANKENREDQVERAIKQDAEEAEYEERPTDKNDKKHPSKHDPKLTTLVKKKQYEHTKDGKAYRWIKINGHSYAVFLGHYGEYFANEKPPTKSLPPHHQPKIEHTTEGDPFVRVQQGIFSRIKFLDKKQLRNKRSSHRTRSKPKASNRNNNNNNNNGNRNRKSGSRNKPRMRSDPNNQQAKPQPHKQRSTQSQRQQKEARSRRRTGQIGFTNPLKSNINGNGNGREDAKRYRIVITKPQPRNEQKKKESNKNNNNGSSGKKKNLTKKKNWIKAKLQANNKDKTKN